MIRYFAIGLAFFLLAGCWRPECSNERIAEVVSPDGTKKLVLFSRDCGATTGFNTQGMILDYHDVLPNEAGTTFIVDGGSANAFWEENSKVVVTLQGAVRVFKKEHSDRGITIEYQTQ